MKILITRFSGGSYGGAEMSAADISTALTLSGHNVTYWNDKTLFVISPRPRHSLLWRLLWPVKAAMFFVEAFMLCFVKRFDALSPQSREDQIVLTAVGRLLNIPVVWRDPGDLPPQLKFTPQNTWHRLNRSLQLWAIRNTDAIFTLNKEAATEITATLESAGIKKEITSIKSNVLFSDYDLDAEPFETDGKIIVGFMSRLEKHKGLEILIEALSKLPSDTLNRIELWVVGDGIDRKQLEQAASAVGGLTVTFFGYQNELSPYLRTFDIFVQPSEFEGWGRTVKETMYFGVPVIGSDVGGIAEQIVDGENGLLFPVGDSDRLRALLQKLVDNPELRNQLGQTGQEQAESDGDWRTTVEEEIIPLFQKHLKDNQ